MRGPQLGKGGRGGGEILAALSERIRVAVAGCRGDDQRGSRSTLNRHTIIRGRGGSADGPYLSDTSEAGAVLALQRVLVIVYNRRPGEDHTVSSLNPSL